MYSDTTKQVYYQMVARFYPRDTSVPSLVQRVETACLVGGEEGAYFNGIPLGTRRNWVARFLRLQQLGREREATGLSPLKKAKRGRRPVFTPEVSGFVHCMRRCD